MISSQPISMTTAEASHGISPALRNNIYSALLSDGGIRNIESTLDEQLRISGFKDELRRYITDLFRSGEATTVEEARTLAMDKIRGQMRARKVKTKSKSNNASDDEDHTNGVNGVNGTANPTGDHGHVHVDDYKLVIPDTAIREGTKTVMKELEKVCDITYEHV